MTTTTKTPTAAEKAALDAAAALGATPVDEHDEDVVDAEVVEPGTDLAVATDNLPARTDDHRVLALLPEDDEWSDVADGDLAPGSRRIPYLKVDRNLGAGFTDPDSGAVVTELDFVWLAKGRSRAYFDKEWKASGDNDPACTSADGTTALPSSRDMQNGGDCRTCPLAVWGPDGEKPKCGESIEALIFVKDPHGAGQLRRTRFSGIAFAPARDFWDSFFNRMPVRPPLSFLSHITLEPKTTDYGDKLAPVFQRIEPLGRQEAQPLIDARDRSLIDWTADVAADAADGTGHNDSDDAGDPFDERPFTDEDKTLTVPGARQAPDPDEKF